MSASVDGMRGRREHGAGRRHARGALGLLVVAAGACLLTLPAAGTGQVTPPTCLGVAATLVGTEGPDKLNGGPGDDVIVGLGGDDEIDGLLGNDRICGGAGHDTIFGDDGNDEIAGEAGDDAILGLAGNDVIDGGPGDDGIDGGLGDDRLTGGDGFGDLLAFITDTGPVTADLVAGTATGQGSDVMSNFEAVAGSAFDDLLIGGAGGEFFFPREGNDVVRADGGFDLVVFQGRVQASLVTGRATGEGNDTWTDAEGLAAFTEGIVGSELIGDSRDNFLFGSPGEDVLRGGGGADVVIGNAGADRLLGEAGADLILGGGGNDRSDGGAGEDIASFLNATTGVRADLAAERSTGEGTDRLRDFERIAGSQFNDFIAGDGRPNSLEGKGGNDRMLGRGGPDLLDGGSGTDQLDGGAGQNYCVDGERRTRCQVSERTSSPSVRLARAVTGSAAPLHALVRALGREGAEAMRIGFPTLVAGGGAMLGDGVQYLGVPICIRGGTTIAPPRFITPLAVAGTQVVQWRGILRRGGRVVHRTPLAEAVIAGSRVPPGVAIWTDTRRRAYPSQTVRFPARGRYRWSAELVHVQTRDRVQRSVYRHPPPPDCAG